MKVVFELICGGELFFTAFENSLLMIHTKSMSAQLVLNEIGVKIDCQPKNIKVGFLSTRSEAYHSFYFQLGELDGLVKLFKGLGFPLHDMDVHES